MEIGSDAVVADGEYDVGPLAQRQANLVGLAVAYCVVHRFLGNSVEVRSRRRISTMTGSGYLKRHPMCSSASVSAVSTFSAAPSPAGSINTGMMPCDSCLTCWFAARRPCDNLSAMCRIRNISGASTSHVAGLSGRLWNFLQKVGQRIREQRQAGEFLASAIVEFLTDAPLLRLGGFEYASLQRHAGRYVSDDAGEQVLVTGFAHRQLNWKFDAVLAPSREFSADAYYVRHFGREYCARYASCSSA